MKIQFALVDPSLVVGNGVTALAGIVQTDQVIKDYATIPFAFHPAGEDKIVVAKHASSQSLLGRDAWDENITTASFHHLLTLPIWKGVSSSAPAGEIAFVKTDFPGTPDGQSTYAIFGLIKGDDLKLKAMSGRVFECTTDPVQVMGPWDLIKTSDTGIKAVHVMGNQILDCFREPIWGFDEEQSYGISSDISIPQYQEIEEGTAHLLKTGKGKPGSLDSHPDPKYLDFLRGMEQEGLIPSPQWQTAGEMGARDEASSRILREIINGERVNGLKKTGRQLGIDDSPSP